MPALVGLGILLVVFQPRITAWVEARHEGVGAPARDPVVGAWWVWPAVLGAGVYGGYFGAAQGVLLMGIMGVGIAESLQRLNALKNVLAGVSVDLADTATGVLAVQDKAVSKRTGVMLVVPAILAVLSGLAGLRQKA